MKIIQWQQGSQEWLQARTGIATASCFADIMAKVKSGEAATRKNYRSALVVERLTGQPIKTFKTFAMIQGTEREPDARMAYMITTGNVVDEIGLCLHDTLAAGSSPDGLIGDDGGLEIKCPERSKHLEYLTLKTAPSEYMWQIDGGMWITGRQWWDFVSYNPDFPEKLQLVVRRINRDESRISLLSDEVEKFLIEVDEAVRTIEQTFSEYTGA